MTKYKLNSTVKSQRAIFGNPRSQKVPNISNYGGGFFSYPTDVIQKMQKKKEWDEVMSYFAQKMYGDLAEASGKYNPEEVEVDTESSNNPEMRMRNVLNAASKIVKEVGKQTKKKVANGEPYVPHITFANGGDIKTRDAVIPIPIPTYTIRGTSDVPRNDTIITRRVLRRSLEDAGRPERLNGGIHIDPSKRGTFTAAATKHGMSVQGFASKVLANKEDYSPAMVKKANFYRNFAK